MSDPVLQGEYGTDFVIAPPNVGKLLGVDEDKEADEGDGEALAGAVAIHHLHEHLGVHGDIEGAGHIHGAGKDLAAVPEEVVYSL